MRDFNRNGKIDGHDWHIYDIGCRKRLEILKRNDEPSYHGSSKHKETSWKTAAIIWGIVVALCVLITL